MSRPLVILGIAAALAFAACGDDEPQTTAGETESKASSDATGDGGGRPGSAGQSGETGKGDASAAAGTDVKLADSQFGPMLFDGADQAIYLFDKETSQQAACYGECAEAWPPVVTKGDPIAGFGVDAKLLGTTERDDGSTQVTYNGHPLYYYAHEGRGEVLCHGVDEFGGLWLVVDAGGNALPA